MILVDANVRKYVIINYICRSNVICMKYLRIIVIMLPMLLAWVSAHSQQREQMYVADTLSNLTRAEMFYAMAADEIDPKDKRALYHASLKYYDQACRDSSVSTHTDSVDVFINMSLCCHAIDSISPVTPLLQKAADIVAARYGVESEYYVDVLRRIAVVCNEMKDYAQAEELLDKCADIMRRSGNGCYDGFSPHLYAAYLLVRADNEQMSDRYASALKYSKLAHKVMTEEKVTEEEVIRKFYQENLWKLAYLYGRNGALRKAVHYNSMAAALYRKNVEDRLGRMSEARRNVYWENASMTFDDIMTSSAATDAFDACLFSKGLLLNTSIEFRKRVEESGNKKAKKALAVMDSLVAAGADVRQIDSADLSIVRLLGKDSGKQEVRDIRWQDVQNALGDDDLAIEFVSLSDGRYAALLLRKGWKSPQMVEMWTTKAAHSVLSALLKQQPLQEYVNKNDRKVSEAIWSRKIRRHFPITDEGRIFFSADGLLHQIGIEYLPLHTDAGSKDNSTIMDNYKIYRLSSTRELVMKPEWTARLEGSASIYGGAMFNPPKRYLSYAVSLLSETDSSLVDSEYEQRALEEERKLKGQGKSSKYRYASDKEYIAPLPATIREVHEIDSMLVVAGADTRLYTGVFANEESFKSRTAGRDIIHVATHGFYVSASDALSRNEYYKAHFAHNPAVLADPLYRSGFHLAGASPAWAGLSNYVGLEDGVMTAKEISLMDFSSADLVVLSACRTAAGDVSRDGVYGLQRAFKNAGAKSIIMSLWEVDDQATYMMMSNFYRNRYVLGMSKYEAFAEAQRQLRARYPDAYYWRAFILLDPEI